MNSWRPFCLAGQTYELTHLDKYVHTYVQPAKGDNPERKYVVEISFSLHCFTRGPEPGESTKTPYAYSDAKETRIFDTRRYGLSKSLKTIVEQLSMSACFHTNHSTYFSIKHINEQGVVEDYEIYFSVSKPAGRDSKLQIFVITAYPRDREYTNKPAGRRNKKINFFVILNNVLQGKATRPAP